jgi:lipopolysaccharide export system permease protein
MRILDAYIFRIVAQNLLLVLLALIGLFLFFTFIEELDQIGKGTYGTTQAIQSVIFQIPKRIYEFYPAAALLGSLLGLGILANTNELTVIRAAGVSITRIVFATLRVGFIFMLMAMALGEIVEPYTQQWVNDLQALKQSHQGFLTTSRGVWVRDGTNFIHIGALESNNHLQKLQVFNFNEQHRLKDINSAQHAHYNIEQGKWQLETPKQLSWQSQRVVLNTPHSATWESILSPELVKLLALDPKDLSLIELSQYILYLNDNNLHATPSELVFWQRIFYPLITLVMTLSALPFIFGSLRTVTVGQRILVAALLGIVFHVLNQMLGHTSLLYGFPPLLGALLPVILMSLFTMVLIKRTL